MALVRTLLLLAACASVASAVNWDVNVAPNGGFTFDPSSLAITVGDTVTWRWQGSGHNVVQMTGPGSCTPQNGGFSSGATASTGTVFTFKFEQAGAFFYACQPHCSFGMQAAIVVSPNQAAIASSVAAIQSAASVAAASASVVLASASAYAASVLNAASKAANTPAPTGGVTLPKCITGAYTLVDTSGDRVIMCDPGTQSCYFSTDGGASFAMTPFSQLNADTPTPSMTISSSSGRLYSVSRAGLHVRDPGTLTYALRAVWNCDGTQCRS
eukprot:Opistho-1_new@61495